LDSGKTRKTFVEVASHRTFWILTYSQLSGTKVKAVIRQKSGYKAEDRAGDLSGLKHDATLNNVTIEAIAIYL
jgi:hypothetical protein